jgi:pimeloyl-ACP methyl ester carboxylesterase
VNSENVTFDSDGCTLAGTYAQAAQPVAAALLIPGSGRTDRDSDVKLPLGMKLRGAITRAVADALGTVNVSSLRYDKRGVGASGGDYYPVGMATRLIDAQAALSWLAERNAGLPLLVVGHSEGTYYTAQLAGEHRGVAGIVLISGSVRPGGDVLAWQTQQLADKLPAATKVILKLLRTDVVRAQRKNQAKIMASTTDVIRVQGTKVNARWIRDFITYDPAPALRAVTVPVLAITGGHDMQVPPDDVEAAGRLVQEPFEGHVVGDLSHMLRPDPDFVGPRGYRKAGKQPVSPEVLGLITDWAARQFGQQQLTRQANERES